VAAGFIITLLVCRSVCAQQATGNKTQAGAKETKNTASSAKKTEADPQTPPPPVDWLHREKLTGDWGGARKKMEERGFTFELEFTQFYQGTAAGGLEQDDAYGGRIDADFKFDLGKLGLWKNGIIETKAVTRYGKSVNELTGALLPANTALIVPAEEGTVTAITTLKYTHIFPFEQPGDLFLISVGKFDTIDLVADPLIGGAGLNKFLNLNQVAPSIGVRNIPPVSIGWVGAWVRKGEPFISLTVLDSQDSSTTVGLSNLFEEGITIMPAVTLPSRFFRKAGHHTFSFSYSNQRTTPFDQLRQVILPERFGAPRDCDRIELLDVFVRSVHL
jgi:porin